MKASFAITPDPTPFIRGNQSRKFDFPQVHIYAKYIYINTCMHVICETYLYTCIWLYTYTPKKTLYICAHAYIQIYAQSYINNPITCSCKIAFHFQRLYQFISYKVFAYILAKYSPHLLQILSILWKKNVFVILICIGSCSNVHVYQSFEYLQQ